MMKQRSLFVVCLILGTAGWTTGQTKRVTNSDLEKYRAERLKAERDYKENYAKMGFPSQEELDRRREQSRIESERVAAQLRAERLERERVEAERQISSDLAAAYYYNVPVEQDVQDLGYYYSLPYGRHHRYPFRNSIYGSKPFRGREFRPAFDVGTRQIRGPKPSWKRP